MYGKVLAKLHEGPHTISLQENGRFYEMNSTISGRHRLCRAVITPARLQEYWECVWFKVMEHSQKERSIKYKS